VVAKEALGIAAGLDQARRKLRQPCADDRDRELKLPDAVESGQDCTQFIGIGELHLVEEERDACVCLSGSISEFEEDLM
jgi:hypothetical protein